MSVTGNRADRIVIDDPLGPCKVEPGTARQWFSEDGRTLADCKAKFEWWTDRFVGLDRPRTMEAFRREYIGHWPPDDDGDEDTRL